MNENVDYDKMWKEIIEANWIDTHILPGEKTIKMFAEEANISEDIARRILTNYVKTNKMRTRTVQLGKAKVAVYSPIIEK